jgi:YfiH family protein
MNGLGSRGYPHLPTDTLIELPLGIPGVRAGFSRRPVDAADRVGGIAWAARAAVVPTGRVALLRQVHGGLVVSAPWPSFPDAVEGDALITAETGLALCVRVADCAPVALAAPGGRAIGLVHAGWRGVRAGVVAAGVAALAHLAGCTPDRLRAAVGPMIGPCCYRVGPEFRGFFEPGLLSEAGGILHFDLPAAVRAALSGAGLRPERVDEIRAWCGVCGRGAPAGVTLHSHRESQGGPGRNIAFIVSGGPD